MGRWLASASAGVVVGLITFLITLLIFRQDTGMFLNSFYAAVITGALVWASYELIRWLLLAMFSK